MKVDTISLLGEKATIYLVTMDRGNDAFITFKVGLEVKMNSDSRIFKLNSELDFFRILKFSTSMSHIHFSEWSLIDEWGGVDRGTPVRRLTPLCSAILADRVRDVMPT